MTYLFCLGYERLEPFDALFDLAAMVYMYVSGKVRVALFVDLDDYVEQLADAFACTADGRDYRHAEEISQLRGVQFIAACEQLVIHVKGHHNPQVHVDQLGRKIQVALEVGCVYYIYDNVRSVVDKVLADVQLLRAVG